MKRPRYVEQLATMTMQMCRYPHGHPGEPNFHFCCKKVVPGKPYCDFHCGVAYQRPKLDAEAA